jgi:hypothetical protein
VKVKVKERERETEREKEKRKLIVCINGQFLTFSGAGDSASLE